MIASYITLKFTKRNTQESLYEYFKDKGIEIDNVYRDKSVCLSYNCREYNYFFDEVLFVAKEKEIVTTSLKKFEALVLLSQI